MHYMLNALVDISGTCGSSRAHESSATRDFLEFADLEVRDPFEG